jgi:hypothetical protein
MKIDRSTAVGQSQPWRHLFSNKLLLSNTMVVKARKLATVAGKQLIRMPGGQGLRCKTCLYADALVLSHDYFPAGVASSRSSDRSAGVRTSATARWPFWFQWPPTQYDLKSSWYATAVSR